MTIKDDNLFAQPEPEEEDSPFGRKGLFSTTGGGLFDDDDEKEDKDVRKHPSWAEGSCKQ